VIKRLAVFFDGTWNVPDQKDGPTNVVKLYAAVADRDANGMQQRKFYDTGVGTGLFDRLRGGAFGWGLSEKIKEGYLFIVDSFEPGDEIFLFGFSRGAYTARSTAGLIRNCGILKRESRDKLEQAYALYRRRDPDSHPDADESQAFRNNYSYETNIKFIGVWDTVGSLGIPVGIPWLPVTLVHFIDQQWEFHDVQLSRSVENAYQALAIDERRRQFMPTLWKQHPQPGNQVMEQVWFAGVHSNVGGGYKDTGLSDVTFLWMQGKAELAGLAFDPDYVTNHIHPDPLLGVLYDSRVGFYQFLPGRDRTIGEAAAAREAVDPSAEDRHARARNPEYAPATLMRYLARLGAAVQAH
jgi:uncharacterized protein (DUF2235 family)